MEHLWAPWRSQYIEQSSKSDHQSDDCIFCVYPNQSPEHFVRSLILHCNEDAFVIMNRYPYNAGHLMVVPRQHVHVPTLLSPVLFSHLCSLLNETISIINQKFQPDGLNVGMNIGKAGGAGIEMHCHFHIVPRWSGDTNFMPVLGNTKVISESLSETYKKLLPAFQSMQWK